MRYQQLLSKLKDANKAKRLILGLHPLDILIIVVLLVGGGTGIYLLSTNTSISKQKKTSIIQISKAQTTPTVQPITASNIVTLLNQQRTAKGLTAFKWITQLNNAAVARANYMVANDTTSLNVGSPYSDITNAGYDYSSADVDDTWNDTSTQEAVNYLITGVAATFGLSTSYSDIGVGVVSDTVNGASTQLIIVYLANQSTPSVSNNSSTSNSSLPTYTLPPPPSIASQCSSEITTEDNYYKESISGVENDYASTISEEQANLNGAGTDNSWEENDAQELLNTYTEANTSLTNDYNSYISAVSGYVPQGGQAGDCTPDLGAPTLYPTTVTGGL